MAKKPNRYAQLIGEIFRRHYKANRKSFEFAREEIETLAGKHSIKLPKNLGDLVYSFRYRVPLPDAILATAPEGFEWVIRAAGRGRYRFDLVKQRPIIPNALLAEVKIPDSTPGLIDRYALSDEQALLARVRYNRLVDIFSGVACYSLQSHLRSSVPEMGQVETDEVYVGVDRTGVHYVFPVQAKGGRDRLNVVQIEQDLALCKSKFPALICRPIAAQFMADQKIALFSFVEQEGEIRVDAERHYRLVAPDEISSDDLKQYRKSLPM